MMLAITATPVKIFAASEKTLTYDYYFEADSPDDLSYPADEEIEIDGRHYRLKEISCDLYSEPLTEKRKVGGKTKTAEEYLTKTVEGTEFRLYAPAEIKWKDNGVTYTQEYKTEEEVPLNVEYEGKMLALRDITPVSRTDSVTAKARFYSEDTDTTEYIFNGKTVNLSGGEPKWPGWQEDYAAYLGIQNDNDYEITGTRWQGRAQKSGNGYVRYAVIYGTKNVNYVSATYGLSDESERYTATITYKSKYIGHATAVYERYLTTKQKLVYAGVGIAILTLLTTAILFLLKRRKKEEEEITEPA